MIRPTRTAVSLVVVSLALVATNSAFAQGGPGRGFAAMRDNSMWLLNSEGVQKELELSDDQLKDLQDMREEMTTRIRDLFSGLSGLSREDRNKQMEKLRAQMQDETKRMEQEVQRVLLPHQVARLKQLGFQSSGRGRGAGGALTNDRLLDELGVSDAQRKQLEEAAEKARAELQKKYQKMVQEAEDDILSVLTKAQREKYKELVGDPFQFDTRGAFGRPGQRGDTRGGRGRGGNRGGNRGGGNGSGNDF